MPGKFLNETSLTILRGQFREGRQLYRLNNELRYYSALLRTLVTVPAGFITDLASVPKLPLTWLLAGGTGQEAAVIHDWLYSVHAVNSVGINRSMADAVFREAVECSEDTQANPWLMWAAVYLFGSSSWNAPNLRQEPVVAMKMAQQEVQQSPQTGVTRGNVE